MTESRKRSRHWRLRKPWGAIAFFIGPIMAFYLVFTLYPVCMSFVYSVHKVVPTGTDLQRVFVGLDNYRALLTDDIFQSAVHNTLIWGIVGTIAEMLTAIVLAVLVYFRVPLHSFYRTIWFTPVLVSGVIIGLVFRWVFNYQWGLLNTGLRRIGLDALALDWLGRAAATSRYIPLGGVIFVHWWATFGYSFVLLLAGLTAISDELLEAAAIDGATTSQIVTRVMLPILKPTFVTVLTLSFLGKMHAFGVVWVLTGGGPMHMTETVATYVQKRAFDIQWSGLDLGYPSAIAVAWFGVILVGLSLLSRGLRSQAME